MAVLCEEMNRQLKVCDRVVVDVPSVVLRLRQSWQKP